MNRPPKVDLDAFHADLDTLKLAFVREHYDEFVTIAARQQWDHLPLLARPLEGEAARRRDRAIARRIRLARFPVNKTLDAFDWTWPKKINRQQVMNLFRLHFVEQASNVVFIGGVGLGKSHLAIALGRRACEERYSVLFASAVDVINTLAAAQAIGRLKQGLNRYIKPRVLVLDELGYLPIDKTGADLLFQIISQRYERGSTIIYVIWNISSGGLFHALSTARVPQSRAERWAKGGKVRSPNRPRCRSGTTWTNRRARFAGSASRAWLRCRKRSSGSGSNRCSGSPRTPSRRMGGDWKTSSAGARGRESSRAVRVVMM